jgi:hypothetical protein
MDPDRAAAADGQEQLPEHATVASAPPSYLPASQFVQTEEPAIAWYLPASQMVQTVDPAICICEYMHACHKLRLTVLLSFRTSLDLACFLSQPPPPLPQTQKHFQHLQSPGTFQPHSRYKQSPQKLARTFLRNTNVSLACVNHARVMFHARASGREICSTARASAREGESG